MAVGQTNYSLWPRVTVTLLGVERSHTILYERKSQDTFSSPPQHGYTLCSYKRGIINRHSTSMKTDSPAPRDQTEYRDLPRILLPFFLHPSLLLSSSPKASYLVLWSNVAFLSRVCCGTATTKTEYSAEH